nr:putative site-specific DNA endonuclease [Eudorina elegans]
MIFQFNFSNVINLLHVPSFKFFQQVFLQEEILFSIINAKDFRNKKEAHTFINGVFCVGCLILYLLQLPQPQIFKNFLKQLSTEYTNLNNTVLNKAIEIIISYCALSLEQSIAVVSFKNILHNNQINATTPLKIYYVYRLTCDNKLALIENIENKRYYYGYRATNFLPLNDKSYLSSSKIIKGLVRKHGSQFFSKKILGIYVYRQHAIHKEVCLHTRFNVRVHEKFFNLANQTTTKFVFDNTGRVQTLSSNEKRSKRLKNISKHTPESREKLREFQLNREHSIEEQEKRREHAQKLNKTYVVCPYCNKEVQKVAAARWHFKNCLKNPNVSEKTIAERDQLRQKAIARNKDKHKN